MNIAGVGKMVDIITPPSELPENLWIVELIVIIFCFVLAVTAVVAAGVGNYLITIIAMILSGFFVIIILAFKGSFRKK